ncbi:MAG: hypothetical protein ABF331_08740 [Hellea sp.]
MQRLATLIAEKIFEVSERRAAKEPEQFYAVDENSDRYEITEYEFIGFQIEELQDIEREHVSKEEYQEALNIQKLKIQILKDKRNKL